MRQILIALAFTLMTFNAFATEGCRMFGAQQGSQGFVFLSTSNPNAELLQEAGDFNPQKFDCLSAMASIIKHEPEIYSVSGLNITILLDVTGLSEEKLMAWVTGVQAELKAQNVKYGLDTSMPGKTFIVFMK